MKVLVVTPWFPTKINPVSGIFHLRDVELLSRTHEVVVLHLTDEEVEQTSLNSVSGGLSEAEFEIIRLPYSLWRPWDIYRARKLIEKSVTHFDFLHTMSGPALIPFFKFSKIEKPWLHTEHWTAFARKPYTLRERVGLRAIKSSYDNPQVIVAVSEFLATALNKLRSGPVKIIGNFVRRVEYRPQAKPSPREDVLRLICVGSLIERKSPLLAVETLAAVIDMGRPAELTFVGEGPLLNKINTLSVELGVQDQIRLLGNVSNEMVHQELARADVFLAPGELETFGVAIAEAMMSGLPVVTADNGGSAEFLNPTSSRIVNSRKAQDYADQIISLVASTQFPTREQISDSAQALFDEDIRAEKYAEAYELALELYEGR